MTAIPGQAAYETWMALSGDEDPYGWSYKHEPFRIHWKAVAQAAIDAYLAAQSGPWPERAAEILAEGKP